MPVRLTQEARTRRAAESAADISSKPSAHLKASPEQRRRRTPTTPTKLLEEPASRQKTRAVSDPGTRLVAGSSPTLPPDRQQLAASPTTARSSQQPIIPATKKTVGFNTTESQTPPHHAEPIKTTQPAHEALNGATARGASWRQKASAVTRPKHAPLLARSVSYEYDIGGTLAVLFSYHGTFWPHVLRTHELYLFPLLHTVLVLLQWSWQQEADNDVAAGVHKGTFWRTVFEEVTDDDDEFSPKVYWENTNMMIPWKTVGMLTPLMVFALVFFLGQCYSRFMTFFYACQVMETAIQDVTVLMLTHASRHKHRWDSVRYLTAAAITTYGRVTDLANIDENKRRCKPSMDLIDWERLLQPERVWHGEHVADADSWDTVLGWPRAAGAEELAHTEELHASLGTSAEPPSRLTSCPALLKVHEVDELRHYPDSMVTLVLITWCVQTIKELELLGEFKGPSLGQAQGEHPNVSTPCAPFSPTCAYPIACQDPLSSCALHRARFATC